jgi:hypothetical protein
MSKQLFKLAGFGDIVVILQHRQQQAFAKPAGVQEEELLSGFFDQPNPVRAVYVKIVFGDDLGDDLIEVCDSVGKFHDVALSEAHPLNLCNSPHPLLVYLNSMIKFFVPHSNEFSDKTKFANFMPRKKVKLRRNYPYFSSLFAST